MDLSSTCLIWTARRHSLCSILDWSWLFLKVNNPSINNIKKKEILMTTTKKTRINYVKNYKLKICKYISGHKKIKYLYQGCKDFIAVIYRHIKGNDIVILKFKIIYWIIFKQSKSFQEDKLAQNATSWEIINPIP